MLHSSYLGCNSTFNPTRYRHCFLQLVIIYIYHLVWVFLLLVLFHLALPTTPLELATFLLRRSHAQIPSARVREVRSVFILFLPESVLLSFENMKPGS